MIKIYDSFRVAHLYISRQLKLKQEFSFLKKCLSLIILFIATTAPILSFTAVAGIDSISSNFSHNNNLDTIAVDSAFAELPDTTALNANTDTSKYVSQSEFMYGDVPRYTITGRMPLKNTEIDALNFTIFSTVFTGFMVSQHIIQMQTIWKEQGDFKFNEDGRYALWADKVGHFFGAYFTAYNLSELLMMSGFSLDAATVWGGMLGLSYSTYVEILDGFGKNWGFSPSDFYSDVAGAALFIGQSYVPFLQNFTPKFMYVPADWHGELRRKPSDMFIDDYSSHSMWITVNVHNILPDSWKKYWLPWLDISFGYAARNLCDPFNPNSPCDTTRSFLIYDDVRGSPRFIIALDYNLVKILPDGVPFWNWLKQTLNHFKMPSPAIEIGEVTRFHLLYPFSINLGNIRF